LIRVGIAVTTLGIGLFIYLSPSTSIATIVGIEVLFGLGAGLLFEPPLIAIQACVTQDDVATATASLGLSRNLALALSVVIGGVIFQNGMNRGTASLVAAGLPANVTSLLTGDKAAANVNLVNQISDPRQKLAIHTAFSNSLKDMWIVYTSISACGILASWWVVHKVLSEIHLETKTGLKKEKEDVVLQPITTA